LPRFILKGREHDREKREPVFGNDHAPNNETVMTELSDELLIAYVDGQLARKQASAVDKVLEQDDVIAKRVNALKDAHSRLEAAFDAILAGEQADAETQPVPQGPGLFIPRDTLVKTGLAAAGIVAAFFLIIAGYGWPLVMPEVDRLSLAPVDPEHVGSVPPTWQQEAARAQALLSRDSVEVGLDGQGNRDLIAFQLARAIGPRFALPDLTPHGYRFMRAQLLQFGAEPLAQILYLGSRGAPLALYVSKGEGTQAPSFRRYGGIGGVAWSQGGLSYLLAGDEPEAPLLKLADTIRMAKPEPVAASTDRSPPPPPPRPKPKS
jgi:anti-sigma factor RsiW